MQGNFKFVQSFPANVDGRDFIIGDIHGCLNEVKALLRFVDFDKTKDRLFSTGDLVDRGPYSVECLEFLKEDWFHAVMGNHEDLLLNKIRLFESGEVQDLSQEDIELASMCKKHVPNIMKMPMAFEIDHLLYGKVYVVHAEILPEHLLNIPSGTPPGIEYDRFFRSMKKFDFAGHIEEFFEKGKINDVSEHLKDKLIWSRKFVSSFYKDHRDEIEKGDFSFLTHKGVSQDLKVFCGHNVVPCPIKIGQQYYIDTGAALGYSPKELNSYLFSRFGHEFFTLTMADITTGICYGCVTSNNNPQFPRGKILKLEKSIYNYGCSD